MITLGKFSLWFSGKEVLIDGLSALVLLFAAVSAYRFYRISKKRQYLYLISAFTLLSASFVSKLISEGMVYYQKEMVHQFGAMTLVYRTLETSNVLVFWGLLGHRILALLGFFFLVVVYVKEIKKLHLLFISYLLLAIGYASNKAYFLFHITALVLLGIVTFELIKAYRKSKFSKTWFLAVCFIMLCLSHILFLFLLSSVWFYILAEIMQLIAYTILFIILTLVFHAKKTRTS